MEQHVKAPLPPQAPGETARPQTSTTLNRDLVRESKKLTVDQLHRAGVLPRTREVL